MQSVWNTPRSLEDWGLVFAPPTGKDYFDNLFLESYFLSQFLDWERYKKEIVSDFDLLIAPLRVAGLTVYPNASLNCLRTAVKRHPSVVLIAHCEGGRRIELGSRLVHIDDIVHIVPKHARKIIDFSVCRFSAFSLEKLKARSPKSGFACYKTKIDARASINYVAYFLSQFAKGQISYAQADLLAKKWFLGS